MRVIESIYTELALYGTKHLCARTDTVFLPIYEDCDGTVSLINFLLDSRIHINQVTSKSFIRNNFSLHLILKKIYFNKKSIFAFQ